MAPLNAGDQINMTAMVGTWLGTIFTAVGLIAVFSQLRLVLVGLQQSRKSLLARSAGNWVDLIPQTGMPQQGLVEKVAPGFLGLVQRGYLDGTKIYMTQDHRPMAGTSGWSNLFAHCGIQPSEMIKHGGPNARVFPAVTGRLGSGAPRLADLVFENGRVFYGFSQYEFMALLIICGFCPADFSVSGGTASTKFLGCLQLANYEHFSQLARFDAHEGCRDIAEDKERYINEVPIQNCIDYAIGVLRTPQRGEHSIIIPAHISSSAAEQSGLTCWTTMPRAAQLNEIRYALEQLVSVSAADILKYSVETKEDIDYERATMDQISPGNNFGKAKTHETLLVAHALAALKPWGLLPVLPLHFAQAFKPLLAPFVGSHAETVKVLQDKMCKLNLRPLDGWDSIEQQAMGLGQIGDILGDHFSGSCTPCRNYYKSMNMVFNAHKVCIDDVRNTLAALVARRCLEGMSVADEFLPNLRAHLSHGRTRTEVPPWAVTVFATYTWGWLGDFVKIDFHFQDKTKRRIFLT